VQVRFMSTACFWAGRAQGTMTNQGSGSGFALQVGAWHDISSPIAVRLRCLQMALFRKEEEDGLVDGVLERFIRYRFGCWCFSGHGESTDSCDIVALLDRGP